jgi:hypothetical protein
MVAEPTDEVVAFLTEGARTAPTKVISAVNIADE